MFPISSQLARVTTVWHLPARPSGFGVRTQLSYLNICSDRSQISLYPRLHQISKLHWAIRCSLCSLQSILEGWQSFPCESLLFFGYHYGHSPASRIIPETKGRSLEEMDVIFGSITQEERQAGIDKRERGKSLTLQTREKLTILSAEFNRFSSRHSSTEKVPVEKV